MKFRDRIKRGETVFGTWCMMPSATVAEVIAQSGLDFIILDMEHGSMSYETVEAQVKAIQFNGCQPIIRVGSDDENTILRALETGCQSIMVPHVSDKTKAEKIVQFAKYRPAGSRGLSPYTACHKYDHTELSQSLKLNNEYTSIGVLVEGSDGIANIEDICSVNELDIIYLGMYDISQSLGHPGELDHPEVISKLESCVEIISQSGKCPGIFVQNIDSAAKFKTLGFRFIAYVADSYALKKYYKDKVNEFTNK